MRRGLAQYSQYALAALLLLLGSPARAGAQPEDGSYGRLEGDLSLALALGAGATLAPPGPEAAPPRASMGGEIDLLYLDMAGLRLGAMGTIEGRSRAFVAVELRPLFLGRFLLGGAFGEWFWDLLLDSLSVSLGAAAAPLDAGAGVALQIGVGLALPLAQIDRGTLLGLVLRADHLLGGPGQRFGPAEPLAQWALSLGLSLRAMLRAGLPVWEPSRYRVP